MENQKNNGNQQINNTRESFNEKVSKLSILGKSKKIQWEDKRRFRSI
jgi:hypothetical protein